MANLVQRNALGHFAPFGTLYNARSDKFLQDTILSGELPVDAVSTIPSSNTDIRLSYGGTYEKRVEALDVQPELAASILAGLVKPQGHATYLRDSLNTVHAFHGALRHKVSTARQKLDFTSSRLKEHFDLASPNAHEATHMVIGIEWGLQSIVATEHHMYTDTVERSEIECAFRSDLERLRVAIESTNPSNDHDSLGTELSHVVTVYSDVLLDEGLVVQDIQEACQFIQLVPDHINQEGGRKGKPLAYTLLPLNMLPCFIDIGGEIGTTLVPISPEYLTKFVHLFGEFDICEEKLNNYEAFLASRQRYVAEDHVRDVGTAIHKLRQSKQSAKVQFGNALTEVRSGTKGAQSLWELYHHVTSTDDVSPKHISAIAGQEGHKLGFASMAVAKGATYIGHNGLDIATTAKSHDQNGCYIFLFNQAVTKNRKAWEDNCALLMELLGQPNRTTPVYVADCDAASAPMKLENPRICQYQGGREIASDLLEQRHFLAEKCFARYNPNGIDSGNERKPVKRRFVKIPCPGRDCDRTKACEWTCPRCLAPIEYGYTDQYIYCDCGRCVYSEYDFKCNGGHHGTDFERYDPGRLVRLLGQLDQSDSLNILILGETGVGKSTFINAFVNYLSYSTLDEAKAADGLTSVIPCSFSMQIMDRNNPSQEIQEKTIRVGSRDDESDGTKGASATQQTGVYPVTIGSTMYRLIDTPGIGDTRGVFYDRQNMADILKTLSSYDDLHGILILLKSNSARLTVTFKFCIKELLVHLHRSAVTNMAFGFTNTRISNYTPGDTFGPLKSLLAEHSDLGLALATPTTYCFDSESFRYLAAYKNGTFLPNEEDFRRSWHRSSEEACRLLAHFRTRKPHNVKSTLSLNGARQLISELTKPMAEISQIIRNNIAMFEDRKQELKDSRLTADNLRKKLHLEKVQFDAKQLSRPRTVCKKSECCEFKDSGKGDGEVVTIYKTHCHPVCYLDNVKGDVVADPGLIDCYAFQGKNVCTECRHRWQEHLHILYELKEVTVQVKDTEIERQLQANANDVTLRQTGIREIEQLIEEFRSEHRTIQEAAARFGLFLKKNAIAPLNDATLDYIDMLIQQEETKIQAGRQASVSVEANLKRLKALREDKRAHIELVDTLTKNMTAPKHSSDRVLDEKGVSDAVTRLYNLKHFGNNLMSVKNTITSAHRSTYRERPFRVQQPSHRRWNPLPPDEPSSGAPWYSDGTTRSSAVTTRYRIPMRRTITNHERNKAGPGLGSGLNNIVSAIGLK